MRRISKGIILFMLFILFFSACQFMNKNEGNEDIQALVNEWQGKRVIIPQDLVFTQYATDTIDHMSTNNSYKVFIYVDSIGCLSCKLQLPKWKQIITEFDSITNHNISYLFVFDTRRIEAVKEVLEDKGFDYPVCIDVDSRLNNLNKFSSDTRFQTFLLGRDNKIEVIGNPVRNFSVQNLYVKALQGDTSETLRTKHTVVSIPEREMDLGTISLGDVKTISFSIMNVGDAPLMIEGITTSCDCTSAEMDCYEVPVNESAKLMIHYKADIKGDFLRTVSLCSNTEEAEIEFVLTGKVI